MRIAISGASGLVGTALRAHLARYGHEVSVLARGESAKENAIPWNPYAGPEEQVCDPRRLEGVEAFIHLSGESVAARRWTPAQSSACAIAAFSPPAIWRVRSQP